MKLLFVLLASPFIALGFFVSFAMDAGEFGCCLWDDFSYWVERRI